MRVLAAITACLLALAQPSWGQDQLAPRQRPDFSALSRAEVRAVVREMPKGGDLHIHLSGAPYAETYLGWAAEDGLCVDTRRWALTDPCTPGGDQVLASSLTGEQRAVMIDSLSTRRDGFADRSGHDQFFTAFDRFGATRDFRRGDMLADLMATLASQNTFYVEVMWMPQSRQARELGRVAGWTEDLSEIERAVASGLPALVAAAMAETDAVIARAEAVLGCRLPAAPAQADGASTWPVRQGCDVTVRFLVQANRLLPPEQTYGQLALGAALIEADPRWVGLQLVAPEDHPNALANYDTHMAMFAHMVDRGVPVALHAGELTLDYATPEDISDHVGLAVQAGARRIGHGVTIPSETSAYDLIGRMADAGVAVEVNLTSNATILGVEGDDHPVIWLRQAGVPVIYTTDDPGISRSDLSNEYTRAVLETGATYEDLVTSARNALAFSFLPGEALWLDPGQYQQFNPACSPSRDVNEVCQALLDASPLAREQHRFERLLADFESAWSARHRR